jgi:hypothetical protein
MPIVCVDDVRAQGPNETSQGPKGIRPATPSMEGMDFKICRPQPMGKLATPAGNDD